MENKTALLITYYWPPAGGAGVHRWLRFSKYFKENGWNLHVFCPEDAAWPTIDEALLKEVAPDIAIIRRKIFEPHRFLGKKNNPTIGSGITRQQKQTFVQRSIVWIRGNLFIPDARKYWIRPSARFLNKYLKEHPEITTIVSTGPPHSMHLIALAIKKKHNIHWVADFRDPWTEIDFYADLRPGRRADALQKKLEKEVLNRADVVVSISKSCADGLSKIGQRNIECITNGFEFPTFDKSKIIRDEAFSIAHFGSMAAARNPEVLWKTLAKMLPENDLLREKLQIHLIGPVDFEVFRSAASYGLSNYIKHTPSVAHSESIRMQRASQLLLLVANKSVNVKGILTGKFFEYLGAKRPILAIGENESDLQKAIEQTQSGAFFDYDESEQLKLFLASSFDQFLNNKLEIEPENTEQYATQNLVRRLVSLFK